MPPRGVLCRANVDDIPNLRPCGFADGRLRLRRKAAESLRGDFGESAAICEDSYDVCAALCDEKGVRCESRVYGNPMDSCNAAEPLESPNCYEYFGGIDGKLDCEVYCFSPQEECPDLYLAFLECVFDYEECVVPEEACLAEYRAWTECGLKENAELCDGVICL